MSEKLAKKVSFEFLRYANCWEDAEILLKALNPHPGSKILSIGSAGDNSFFLLTTDPEMVIAVDISKVQLYLIELKKAAILYFLYNDLLAFLGFSDCDRRDKMFYEIKEYISNEAAQYWQTNIGLIKKGIITQGKFERYFSLFSSKVLPWIHSKATVEKLLQTKTASEQEIFYKKYWNNSRWKLFFKLFFSKYILGKYGRDPAFLNEVRINVGSNIFYKAEEQLKSINAQNNFMLRYSLTGSFGGLLPPYLQPQHIDKVKANLQKLHIHEGYAENATNKYGKFNYMNLSNIFEYMNDQVFTETASRLVKATHPEGRLAYWNLMVPRKISNIFPANVLYEKNTSEILSATDKGFFYDQFIVDCVK